jgi:hypothetical protein
MFLTHSDSNLLDFLQLQAHSYILEKLNVFPRGYHVVTLAINRKLTNQTKTNYSTVPSKSKTHGTNKELQKKIVIHLYDNELLTKSVAIMQ